MSMTFRSYDGKREYTVENEISDLNAFINRFKNFCKENESYIKDLDLDGYLSDAISDGEFIINTFGDKND